MASKMDKDKFCRQWVKKELAACSKTNAEQIEDLERKNRQLTDLIKDLVSHTDRPVDFDKLYRELIKINGDY